MNKIIQWIKNNLFLTCILLCYGLLICLAPSYAWQGVKNSGYYLKEMLTIMPVIFILTALLDTFVPKETIMKCLGKSAKGKGVFLSFVLGSISAGPIYAAFPFCVMLHKKGAAIRNIVIILSAWAVIKIPMLLNEVKFLGFKFMAVRYVLTICAILIFSYVAGKVIHEEDLPDTDAQPKQGAQGVHVIGQACMGCTLCTKKYPELFEMKGKKAQVLPSETIDEVRLQEAMASCPAKAIVRDSSS